MSYIGRHSTQWKSYREGHKVIKPRNSVRLLVTSVTKSGRTETLNAKVPHTAITEARQ